MDKTYGWNIDVRSFRQRLAIYIPSVFFLSLYILEIATKSCICFTLWLTEVYFIFYKKIRFNFDIALNIDIENETESK